MDQLNVIRFVLMLAIILQSLTLVLNVIDIPADNKSLRSVLAAMTAPLSFIAILAALLWLLR